MISLKIEDIPDFNPKFAVAGTFLFVREKILLLQRAAHKPQGETWGVPAGKINHLEDRQAGARRELLEETGISLWPHLFEHKHTFYVRNEKKQYDFIYEVFIVTMCTKPAVNINIEEHVDYEWKTPSDALLVNLMDDESEVIKHTFNL